MLKYNNTHIFTGYLKQLLSSFNLPTCKIYTREFARYFENTGKEDPRILKSFDQYDATKNLTSSVRIGYLKDSEVFNYYGIKQSSNKTFNCDWQRATNTFYSADKSVKGLTKTLVSPGPSYDTTTHKYLGEYLRFIRDYYNINLMSMYNCFCDESCHFNLMLKSEASPVRLIIDSADSNYKIYKIPVKLFADYTIALESPGSVEMFCGLYNSVLDTDADLGEKIIRKTYKKVTNTLFSQPFLYNKLNIDFWREPQRDKDGKVHKDSSGNVCYKELDDICWNIAAREQDLYLFIKVPVSCKSSIVVLEGDYREYNSGKYAPPGKYKLDGTLFIPVAGEEVPETTTNTVWKYNQNRAILNFSSDIDLNNYEFRPISRLQLLAFNTGESYPFADRLIEYLTGSAITSMDDIHDNIARAQRVMSQNKNFFKIEGLWEEKMQNILYDYMMNSGEIKIDPTSKTLKDSREGYHRQLGHTSKSMLFDILGYVDKDTEKTYASYTKKLDKHGKLTAQAENTIQNVDIYNGLYDI
jgi:hypothetical protein